MAIYQLVVERVSGNEERFCVMVYDGEFPVPLPGLTPFMEMSKELTEQETRALLSDKYKLTETEIDDKLLRARKHFLDQQATKRDPQPNSGEA